MNARGLGRRTMVCGVAVVLAVGLGDLWVAPSAVASPQTAPGQQK